MTMTKLNKNLSRLKVKPGMYIKDIDHHGIWGVTRYSLAFWYEIKEKINPETVCKAEVININKYAGSCLRLTTSDDIKILFYGCNAGYVERGRGDQHKF